MFFGLEGLADLLGRSMTPTVHIEQGANKEYMICFHELESFEHFNVDVDTEAELLRIHAQNADRTLYTDRASKLPCGVNRPELITAQKVNGRVVVTVPFEAQGPKKVLDQPALIAGDKPKALKVHVTPAPAGRFEIKHENGVLHLFVNGLSAKDLVVELDGKVLKIAGKTAEGDFPIVRHCKLRRRVLSPSTITAKVEPDGKICISVPDSALEHEHKLIKESIKVEH
ncbi:hypothetical protein T492DRAFT_1141153 [Pavlovales sp. CCMP2436]|nr:hypothetical protein T492DRAFT_1141153 [Pavlovales sp. CCMP2436]